MTDVVECIECGEQCESHDTDSGTCRICGGECWDLADIYGKEGIHPDPDFYLDKDKDK